jgi:hypothetical protein
LFFATLRFNTPAKRTRSKRAWRSQNKQTKTNPQESHMKRYLVLTAIVCLASSALGANYDLRNDWVWGGTNNPNGAWSYGTKAETTLGSGEFGPFVVNTTENLDGIVPGWDFWSGGAPNNTCNVFATATWDGWSFPAPNVILDAWVNYAGAVHWAGKPDLYDLSATFLTGGYVTPTADSPDVRVYVTKNGSQVLLADELFGFSPGKPGAPVTPGNNGSGLTNYTISITPGDYLDFFVAGNPEARASLAASLKSMSYDLRGDWVWGGTNNPNGAWSYGTRAETTLGSGEFGPFVPNTTENLDGIVPGWDFWSGGAPNNTCNVFATATWDGWSFPAPNVILDAWVNYAGAVHWAGRPGTYQLSATFLTGGYVTPTADSPDVRIYITKNGSQVLLADELFGFSPGKPGAPVTPGNNGTGLTNYTITIAQGDYLDFFIAGNPEARASLAATLMVATGPAPIVISNPVQTSSGFTFQFSGDTGVDYTVQYLTDLSQTNWSTLLVTNITASPTAVIDTNPAVAKKFYRVVR